jgi:hypothetical protein
MYRLIFVAATCSGLAGCLTPSAPADPNFAKTDVQSDGVTVVGRYDPTGFNSADARKMASFSCLAGDLASFTETNAGGLTEFQAVCAQGTFHGSGSAVTFTRTGPNSATYTSIYTVNGAVTETEGPFLL